ncbi:MAG: rhodanese-like domain-containing protein [Oscillospiraceae bacterium]|nr:rhodanese-like domain-containing protein [Oscillospiraceae bacterium]
MMGTIWVLACMLAVFSACAYEDEDTDKSSLPPVLTQSSPAGQEEEAAYHKITAETAKEMMEEQAVTVVDVRRAEEYEKQHIAGALLIPLDTITQAPPALPDKEAVLLVYCRTGVRSKQASDKLVELGYLHVYDFGGITDWPYETETGEYKE